MRKKREERESNREECLTPYNNYKLLECEHSTQLSKTSISYYFGNLTNQLYEYVKYKIFNPNRKMRDMNTQFKASKHNSILSNFVNYIT